MLLATASTSQDNMEAGLTEIQVGRPGSGYQMSYRTSYLRFANFLRPASSVSRGIRKVVVELEKARQLKWNLTRAIPENSRRGPCLATPDCYL